MTSPYVQNASSAGDEGRGRGGEGEGGGRGGRINCFINDSSHGKGGGGGVRY